MIAFMIYTVILIRNRFSLFTKRYVILYLCKRIVNIGRTICYAIHINLFSSYAIRHRLLNIFQGLGTFFSIFIGVIQMFVLTKIISLSYQTHIQHNCYAITLNR